MRSKKIITLFVGLFLVFITGSVFADVCTNLRGTWNGEINGKFSKLNIEAVIPDGTTKEGNRQYKLFGDVDGSRFEGGILSRCILKKGQEGVRLLEIDAKKNSPHTFLWSYSVNYYSMDINGDRDGKQFGGVTFSKIP